MSDVVSIELSETLLSEADAAPMEDPEQGEPERPASRGWMYVAIVLMVVAVGLLVGVVVLAVDRGSSPSPPPATPAALRSIYNQNGCSNDAKGKNLADVIRANYRMNFVPPASHWQTRRLLGSVDRHLATDMCAWKQCLCSMCKTKIACNGPAGKEFSQGTPASKLKYKPQAYQNHLSSFMQEDKPCIWNDDDDDPPNSCVVGVN